MRTGIAGNISLTSECEAKERSAETWWPTSASLPSSKLESGPGRFLFGKIWKSWRCWYVLIVYKVYFGVSDVLICFCASPKILSFFWRGKTEDKCKRVIPYYGWVWLFIWFHSIANKYAYFYNVLFLLPHLTLTRLLQFCWCFCNIVRKKLRSGLLRQCTFFHKVLERSHRCHSWGARWDIFNMENLCNYMSQVRPTTFPKLTVLEFLMAFFGSFVRLRPSQNAYKETNHS